MLNILKGKSKDEIEEKLYQGTSDEIFFAYIKRYLNDRPDNERLEEFLELMKREFPKAVIKVEFLCLLPTMTYEKKYTLRIKYLGFEYGYFFTTDKDIK